LTVWAPAEVDVGTVGSILVATDPAPQNVNVLVVVRARKMRRTNYDLPVSVPVAWFGRPLTHNGEYTRARVRGDVQCQQ
jgi:hypothetical protein